MGVIMLNLNLGTLVYVNATNVTHFNTNSLSYVKARNVKIEQNTIDFYQFQ